MSTPIRSIHSIQAKLIGLVSAVLFVIAFSIGAEGGSQEGAALLLDSPLAVPPKPATWVNAAADESRTFGTVTVRTPSGFTAQGGATIIGDIILDTTTLDGVSEMPPGTLFALGIWPGNDQTVYEKPIEIAILVNDALVTTGKESYLTIRQWDPALASWRSLPTTFDMGTYQVKAATNTFTPVAREFPSWGGRTFFAIFRNVAAVDAIPLSTTPAAKATGDVTLVAGQGLLLQLPNTNNAPRMQLQYVVKDDGTAYLSPVNGARIATARRGVTNAQACTNVRYSVVPLAVGWLSDDAAVCLRTSEKAFVLLRFIKPDADAQPPLEVTGLQLVRSGTTAVSLSVETVEAPVE